MMLPSAMKSVRQNQTMFNSKGDKALAIDDVSEWITWQNKPMGFVFFGSILAIISLLTILLLGIFYFNSSGHSKTKLLPRHQDFQSF